MIQNIINKFTYIIKYIPLQQGLRPKTSKGTMRNAHY